MELRLSCLPMDLKAAAGKRKKEAQGHQANKKKKFGKESAFGI